MFFFLKGIFFLFLIETGHMYKTFGIVGFVTVCRYKSLCESESFTQTLNIQYLISNLALAFILAIYC